MEKGIDVLESHEVKMCCKESIERIVTDQYKVIIDYNDDGKIYVVHNGIVFNYCPHCGTKISEHFKVVYFND